MLLQGLSNTDKQQYYLSNCQDYTFLNNQYNSCSYNDQEQFTIFHQKIQSFLSTTEIKELYMLLAVILHLGNVTYEDIHTSSKLIEIISLLLQINSSNLIEQLIHKTIHTNRNEIYQCELSKTEILQKIS
mgnify:CR=1 FL=1